MTQSDSKKEEESNNDDESENFTAFMTSVAEVTEISLKALETKKLDESNGIVGFLEEESDNDNKCELQQTYDQLYKQSYKLTNVNVKLGKRLKKALGEVDSLKKMNIDA